MSRDCEALNIAAKMVGGPEGWSVRLHHSLYDAIIDADYRIRCVGGKLKSRQVIAGIIAAWLMANPGQNPYPK